MREGEALCALCARLHKRPSAAEEETLFCSECGEAPALTGRDLCETCFAEQKRQTALESLADKVRRDEANAPIEGRLGEEPSDADDD